MLQSLIYVGCLIASWAVAGWVTISVMKSQMGQFFQEMRDIKSWRDKFQDEYNKNRIEDIRAIEQLRRECPLLNPRHRGGE
jgi:hypothetical protein